MTGIIRFALKRQGPEKGPSWSPGTISLDDAARALDIDQATIEPVTVEDLRAWQPDRRKSQRVFDPSLNRAYNALRIVQARAKHKSNPGLDARATKQAAKELRRG